MKKKIAIIFGGKSVEHDVSIVTAMQCYNAIKSYYKPILLYIDKENNFWYLSKNTELKQFNNMKKIRRIKFKFIHNGIKTLFRKTKIDCIVNCCHGGIGESGILASILKINDIPQTACDTMSGAVCMNKLIAKKIALGLKIDAPYAILIKNLDNIEKIIQDFDYPIIVKPNNLGSSIGVSKCNDLTEVLEAVAAGLTMDTEILIEQCITPLTEYNCAVYRYKDELFISDIEQPLSQEEMLSFKDKYLSQREKGMKSLDRIIPAKISKTLKEQIETTSALLYNELQLSGVVRIDYLYDSKEKKLYFNEINTVPGSLATYLFENKNLLYLEIVIQLIEQAVSNHKKEKVLNSYFDSEILRL